ncbi:hypothetical protein [Pseudaestuariivita rosea]|uniref:hypothetical protein n=1 Tax=Pseudaestuariivita rosea TaxID=2763263 RepID=UPI001ABB9E3A|nr:hypothetical protein [Pseudaestuariivita rosea]
MTTPLTQAETDWVQRALCHRRMTVWVKITGMILTVFVFVWCTLGILMWMGVDALLDGFQHDRDILPVSVSLLVILTAAGLSYFVYHTNRTELRLLVRDHLKAHANELKCTTTEGYFVDISDGQTNFMLSSRPGSIQGRVVQIPLHWAPLIRQWPDKPISIRLAQVTAYGQTVRIANIVKGKGPSRPTFETFHDPDLIVLEAGPLSVTKEVEAGLGLPRFDSHANWMIWISAAIIGALGAFSAWVVYDNDDMTLQTLHIALGISAVMAVPLVFKLLRRAIRMTRVRTFYRTV